MQPPSIPLPSRPKRTRPPLKPPVINLRQAKQAYELKLRAFQASRKNIFFDDRDTLDDQSIYNKNLRALLRAAKAWKNSAENEPDSASGLGEKANSSTAVKKAEQEIEIARSNGFKIQINSMAGDEDDLSSLPVSQDSALPSLLNLAL